MQPYCQFIYSIIFLSSIYVLSICVYILHSSNYSFSSNYLSFIVSLVIFLSLDFSFFFYFYFTFFQLLWFSFLTLFESLLHHSCIDCGLAFDFMILYFLKYLRNCDANPMKVLYHCSSIWLWCKMISKFLYLVKKYTIFYHSFARQPSCNMPVLVQLPYSHMILIFVAVRTVRIYFLAFQMVFRILYLILQIWFFFLYYSPTN